MGYQPRSPSALPGLRLRNQRTQALIRRDTVWQILAPMLVVGLGLFTLGLLAALPVGAPVRSVWADISLIFLLAPTLLACLVALAVVGGLAVGLRFALRELPYYFKIGQDWMALFTYRVNIAAGKVASTVMSVRSAWAGARRAADNFRSIFTGRRHR